MDNGKSVSLIGKVDLTKPATTLIKKISDAAGVVYEPTRIIREARAKAKAELISVQSEIAITDIKMRAAQRVAHEEVRRQTNIEDITEEAIPLLEEGARPDDMDNDWVSNLFSKMKDTSAQEMQSIWARILAGEANSPGSFSRRTVNILSDLGKRDAEIFGNLCRFAWRVMATAQPLVFEENDRIYSSLGINFSTLHHLQSLGLIHFDSHAGFQLQMNVDISSPSIPFEASYFDRSLILDACKLKNKSIKCGKVMLTKSGSEIFSLCEVKPISDFYEYVEKQWGAYRYEM